MFVLSVNSLHQYLRHLIVRTNRICVCQDAGIFVFVVMRLHHCELQFDMVMKPNASLSTNLPYLNEVQQEYSELISSVIPVSYTHLTLPTTILV